MGVGSGLASSFSVSAESTYGTRIAPARSYRHTAGSINRTQERPQGQGIQSGSYGQLLNQYVETVSGAEGTVAIDVPYSKFGLLLNMLMGGTVAPVQQAATTAYLQTHLLADSYGKSMTGQVGAPYRTGTVLCQEATGLKVTGMEFECEVKGILSAKVNLDGYKFDDTQTLATPTYVDTKPFHGGIMALKLGTYTSETAVTGLVRSVSMNIDRGMDTDDYTAGSSAKKSEPVLNDVTKITGSILADHTTAAKTALHDRVVANTSCSLVWEFTDPTAIASTYFPYIRFTLPSVTFSGDMEAADSVAEVKNSWNYEWRFDGTNLPKIEYMSTDVAL